MMIMKMKKIYIAMLMAAFTLTTVNAQDNKTNLNKEITLEKDIAAQIAELDKKGASKVVGKVVAERALEKGIKEVVFDRGGYIYTGRVAELAAGAREGGLDF